MSASSCLHNPDVFSAALYDRMTRINPGIGEMELYEFRYALANLYPEPGGWAGVGVDRREAVEQRVNSSEFYRGIQLKPRVGDRIVLDDAIVGLTNMLFVGLVTGAYPAAWVRRHFYFDIRGFFFLHRTTYFADEVLAHLGGRPFRQFAARQKRFERYQSVGYKDFKAANAEVDQLFIESVQRLIAVRGTPLLLALAGPTAAGKTEIVARLRSALAALGKQVAAIEMDNFLTDRDGREARSIGSLGREAIHYPLFMQSLEEISRGRRIATPRYDFYDATSSHDEHGRLKPGRTPVEIEPADMVFIEGNFPFLLPEAARLIGIKVVYLTDDAVRMKRKWKRDIDYRKKYEPTYFRNRYFREQFLMAERCYRPQMAMCDMVVDTSGAALWTTPEVAAILGGH
ncbi:MAG TPA: hypothetical protein PLJ35_01620 [Anaerolineae bacterium]|nr:hypothetical protein [Anaerolineae bacterium]HOQ97502.1 hypothetical protein [Anaerolineae bacterium]HPL28884.1 hypothetical protein [Anaerolineae bacterium]